MPRNGIQPPKARATGLPLDRVHRGDCLELLARLPAGGVHLAFADPPFNIGYDYDTYDDRLATDDYLAWSKRWMGEVARVLTDTGTFWLAMGLIVAGVLVGQWKRQDTSRRAAST